MGCYGRCAHRLLGTAGLALALWMWQSPLGYAQIKERLAPIHYGYVDRTHSLAEEAKLVSTVYSLNWVAYYVTQPKTVQNHGSWERYQHNIGRFDFDKDGPFWNWMVHPFTGSQLFLFYRATGHSPMASLSLVFLQSALFETSIEIYTEPASYQDLYQTPVYGAILGTLLEKSSLYLLNSSPVWARAIGHILNPMTLFWFYEGKVEVYPYVDKKTSALNLVVRF